MKILPCRFVCHKIIKMWIPIYVAKRLNELIYLFKLKTLKERRPTRENRRSSNSRRNCSTTSEVSFKRLNVE